MIDNIYDFSEEKRLHPYTLLHNLVSSFPIYFIVVFLFGGAELEMLEILYNLMFAFLLFLVNNFSYFFTYYRINNQDFSLRTGIFTKNKRVIPITKIQNVNISQNFLLKLFKLSRVQIETAGNLQTDALLSFVSNSEAEQINFYIQNFRNQSSHINLSIDKEHPVELDEEKNILFSMNPKELLIFGMLRFRPLFIFFGFWLFNTIQQVPSFRRYTDQFYNQLVSNLESIDILTLSLYIIISVIIILILSWIMDIIWTSNIFYNFKLKDEKNKFIIQSGLFNKSISTIPFKKIHQIVISTNIIKQYFEYYSLELLTAGYSQKIKLNSLAIPNSSIEKIYEVISKLRNYKRIEDYNKISRIAIRKIFVRLMIILLVLSGLLSLISVYYLFILFFVPFIYLYSYLRWKNIGYIFDNDIIYIRTGIIYKKVKILTIDKIQNIVIKESFLQRQFGLATFLLDTAIINNSTAKISDIENEAANGLFELITERINTIKIYKSEIKK